MHYERFVRPHSQNNFFLKTKDAPIVMPRFALQFPHDK